VLLGDIREFRIPRLEAKKRLTVAADLVQLGATVRIYRLG